jgi:hypothetical protein
MDRSVADDMNPQLDQQSVTSSDDEKAQLIMYKPNKNDQKSTKTATCIEPTND